MANVLNVTLNTNEQALDVDQRNNANQVNQNANAQTITWQLTGNAATGSFNSMSATPPGFAWKGTAPPSGIFGTPTLAANGNQITMTDSNTSSSTAGTWVYQLNATINGVAYSTISTLPNPRAGTTDPTIRNN